MIVYDVLGGDADNPPWERWPARPPAQSVENAVPRAPEKLTSLAIIAVEKPNIQ